MSGYLADTSIFVAGERGRMLGQAPDGVAQVSVATLTELGVGVRLAANEEERTVRGRTLAEARRFIAHPFDERVGERLADILAAARDAGRRAGLMDAIIAATALSHDLEVWTQDDDFAVLAELAPELRVRRG